MNPHEIDDLGVVVRKNPDAGVPAGDPVEQEAVTGRTADKAPPNTTMAERSRQRAGDAKSDTKAVKAADVEDKAVSGSRTSTKRK